MRFTKPKKAIGIDIGTHSVKAVQMSRVRGALRVEEVGYAIVDRNQVNMDPVAAHVEALREAIRGMSVNQALLVGALPGQTAVIRYPRLPDMPLSAVPDAIEAEAGQNIPYDLSEVFLDSYPLETVTEGEERMLRVLLVAAKEDVVMSRVQIADAAGVQYGVLTVDSLALADAAESCGFLRPDESVALIDIGLTSSSIHFTRDGISNFIRDVSWGSREFIQAIAKTRHCEYEEAEAALAQLGEETQTEPGFGELEAPSLAEEPAPGGEELETLETPPLSSYESPLDPLAEEMGDLERGPGALPVMKVAADGEGRDLVEVLRGAFGRLISEVRRSFDYYEHQLYERPVERLILCGGVAHLNVVRDTLAEELGVEQVETADPLRSALQFSENSSVELLRERPAQYMVAVGLAARGMAEL